MPVQLTAHDFVDVVLGQFKDFASADMFLLYTHSRELEKAGSGSIHHIKWSEENGVRIGRPVYQNGGDGTIYKVTPIK